MKLQKEKAKSERLKCCAAGLLTDDPSELFRFVRRDPADQRYYCTLCPNFSHASRTNSRNHVEAKHFPNTFHYPCDQCDSSFTTKSTWAMHKSKKHNIRKQQLQLFAEDS